jgi:peptidoglycan/LPS O-acetylase OafA/YrhL
VFKLFEVDRTVLIPLLKALWPFELKWSVWALADLGMALIMALTITAVRPLVTAFEAQIMRLRGFAQALAGFSFTLYLFHWPLIQLMRSWGLGGEKSAAGFAVLLALVVAACAMISVLTERQSPRLRRWMEARFPARGGMPQGVLPA